MLKNYTVTGFRKLAINVTFDGTWDDARDLAPTAGGDFWSTLFQRAYQQQFGVANGGDPGFALMAIVGRTNLAIPDNYIPGKPNTVWAYGSKSPNQGATDINTIRQALADGRPVVASSHGESKTKKRILDSKTGLISNHSYTVIAIEGRTTTDTYVTLRNPWGYDTDHDQKGKYSDGRDGNFDDGLIRVTWSEFAKYFVSYTAGAKRI